MKEIILPIILFIITGCNTAVRQPEKKVDEKALETYFKANIKKYDSSLTLQSFKFIKLDTVSLQNQYYELYNAMLDQSAEYHADIKKVLDKAKINQQIQRLSAGLSRSLYDTYKTDVEDGLKEYDALHKKDSLLLVDMDKLDSIIYKVDSVKPASYLAKCFYVIQKPNLSVTKDTTFISLDLDYNILDRTEHKKMINKLFNPASGFVYYEK